MSNDVVLPENLIQLTTIEPRRVAQSISEMEFALSLMPCGTCGTYKIDMRNYKSTGRPNRSPEELSTFGVECHCLKCGQRRRLVSWTVHDPQIDLALYHVTSHGPSHIIEPWQLMVEIDRLSSEISLNPSGLTHQQWPTGGQLTRALTCATELQKFVVPGQLEILATEYTEHGRAYRTTNRARYLASTCELKLRELAALKAAYAAEMPRINAEELAEHGPPKVSVGELSFATLRAHEEWLKRGKTGTGKLVVKNQTLRDKRFALPAFAELDRVIVEHCRVATNATGATLTDVEFTECSLPNADLDATMLLRVDFNDCNINIVHFQTASLRECKFANCELFRSQWENARVEKCVFQNTQLQDATFTNAIFKYCDFCDNSIGTSNMEHLATTAGARFEDCDFSRTGWKGRDLSGATFVRCKFAGSGGSPRAHTNLVLQDCDMNVDEFLAMLAAWEVTQRATPN